MNRKPNSGKGLGWGVVSSLNWNKDTVEGVFSVLVLLCCLKLCHSDRNRTHAERFQSFDTVADRFGPSSRIFTLESILGSGIINTSRSGRTYQLLEASQSSPTKIRSGAVLNGGRLRVLGETARYFHHWDILTAFSMTIPIYRRTLTVSHCRADGCSALEEY